jgi:hypothetical protein
MLLERGVESVSCQGAWLGNPGQPKEHEAVWGCRMVLLRAALEAACPKLARSHLRVCLLLVALPPASGLSSIWPINHWGARAGKVATEQHDSRATSREPRTNGPEPTEPCHPRQLTHAEMPV